MGLVGESGCGKTTLARAILGILRQERAARGRRRIRFDGEDLLAMPRRRIEREVRGRRITFIPQDPYGSFNPLFPIGDADHGADEVEVAPRAAGRAPRRRRLLQPLSRAQRRRADARGRRRRCCAPCRSPTATRALAKLPHEFSGGQRQSADDRDGAAAAAPTRHRRRADHRARRDHPGADPQAAEQLAKERGVSVLFTTHDLGTAYEICDRIIVMYAGQEVETAPVDAFFRPAAPSLHRAPAREPAAPGARDPARSAARSRA